MGKFLPDEDGVLERILDEIRQHDKAHPDHGVGCSCMDAHAATLRRAFDEYGMYDKRPYICAAGEAAYDEFCPDCQHAQKCKNPRYFNSRSKSLSNFLTVLTYIMRNP